MPTWKFSTATFTSATVSEGGKLDIEMRLKTGRGYVSADKNFDEDHGYWLHPDRLRSLAGSQG